VSGKVAGWHHPYAVVKASAMNEYDTASIRCRMSAAGTVIDNVALEVNFH
jgi:hypothetical protein